MKNILVIGASSAIAQAVCRQYAKQQVNLLLLARDEKQLAEQKSDLELRGAQLVKVLTFEALGFDKHEKLVDQCFEMMPTIDLAFIAYGSLPNQAECQNDNALAMKEINQNGTSVISISGLIAERMRQQGFGQLAVITSVAGDRGRESNYIYGSAKAMLSTYLEGLRARLFKENIYVTDIRPGFVDTPMTANIQNKGLLWAKPDKVATDIVAGLEKRKAVIYTPWFWRCIMLVIKLIPEPIFKRLGL